MTAHPEGGEALLRELDACQTFEVSNAQGGGQYVGRVVPDWLLLRLRAALRSPAPPETQTYDEWWTAVTGEGSPAPQPDSELQSQLAYALAEGKNIESESLRREIAGSGPRTTTGRKVVSIHGEAMLDDVLGIEDEARAQPEAALDDDSRALLSKVAAFREAGFVSMSAAVDAFDSLSVEAAAILARLGSSSAPQDADDV